MMMALCPELEGKLQGYGAGTYSVWSLYLFRMAVAGLK